MDNEIIDVRLYSDLNCLKEQSIGPEVKIRRNEDAWCYGILSVLYDKYPEAFIASSNDKSLFDKGLYVKTKNTDNWITIYFLPNNQVCIRSDFSTRKIPTSVSIESCKSWAADRDDVFTIEGRLIYEDGTSDEFEQRICHFKLNKESYTVNCFGYIGFCTGKDPHFLKLLVPKSIDLFFIDQQREREKVIFDELSFSGNLPEVHFMGDVKTAVVKINAPKNIVVIPESIKDALTDAVDDKYDGEIIYAAPSLCREESIVPGYIKATAWKMNNHQRNDEIVEINSRFIVSVEPEKIECYNPTTGSVIHCASNGIEMHQSIHVYEPVDMIMDKINKSVSRIDANTLLQEIETYCKKHS